VPVWKDGIKLAIQVYELTETECFKGKSSLKDQLEQAAVSVSNNIAEGFERGTTQELLTFIYKPKKSGAKPSVRRSRKNFWKRYEVIVLINSLKK
jgi:four helix bundle protein